MKRGEDHMSPEDFESFLAHLKSYNEFIKSRPVGLLSERARIQLGEKEQSPLRVILCGMGESLLHRNCPEWVGRIRKEVGIRVTVVTNGLLLKESILQRLKENDITVILVSVPGIDEESYGRYMEIDFQRVIKNIERANELLPGRVNINVTIPEDATFTPEQVLSFWQERGIHIGGISLCHNRGGHLQNEALTQIGAVKQDPFCGIIARHTFVAWDGSILSCCHDLHGTNKLGHVSTDDFVTIAEAKSRFVTQGPPYAICRTCNDQERYQRGQILVTTASGKQSSLEKHSEAK